jgi:protein involved in polysaccharide export with SLBB domain
MMRISRGKKIAAIVMLSLCLGMAGCVGTSNDLQPGANGSATQARGSYPGYPNQPGYPGDTVQMRDMAPANGYVRLASGQPMPGQQEDVIVERGLGMPTPMGMGMMQGGPLPLPTELNPTAHPPHRVAAPDILYIEALRLVPKGPYRLLPMEVLQIEATESLRGQPIKGLFMITPEGKINLGYSYRPIPVAGLTLDEAQRAIRDYLAQLIIPIKDNTASVSVTLVQMRGMQNVKGEHLVRPDGTISMGMYGSVFVAGMTLGQVKCTIENHLAAYLIDPQVSVDVFAYNSRKIYIIADGAGYGQQVIALPATGNETVLDAISRVQGLPAVASLKKIWVARPAPAGHPCSQVLPVDWKAITQAGQTTTNYQLLPGDRIYISSDPFICAYNWLDKLLSPLDRVLNTLLLGATTVQTFQGNNTGLLIAR